MSQFKAGDLNKTIDELKNTTTLNKSKNWLR